MHISDIAFEVIINPKASITAVTATYKKANTFLELVRLIGGIR